MWLREWGTIGIKTLGKEAWLGSATVISSLSYLHVCIHLDTTYVSQTATMVVQADAIGHALTVLCTPVNSVSPSYRSAE